jgi:myo-inositol 2-dehydrogenase / D-chiro-inositol 1-dehydrogenase
MPSYIREWEAFVAAVSSGEATPVGPADARAPLVIGLAAARSLQEGRPVRVEEVVAA